MRTRHSTGIFSPQDSQVTQKVPTPYLQLTTIRDGPKALATIRNWIAQILRERWNFYGLLVYLEYFLIAHQDRNNTLLTRQNHSRNNAQTRLENKLQKVDTHPTKVIQILTYLDIFWSP